MARRPREGLRLGLGLALGLAAALLAALPGCSVPPAAEPPHSAAQATPAASQARTAHEYRQDAARHLYTRHAGQIYHGRLPPMLLAVGVLHVEIDREGRVLALHWQRAPKHAPQVMADIESLVRAAAPFPPPRQLGQVVYTDVWLWHQSGKFQLDTLTEGQD